MGTDTEETPEAVEPATTVDVPEPEEGAPDVEVTPAERPSRKERRSAKGADFLAERAELRAAVERERAERTRLERDFAELRGRFTEREKATPKTDPYEAEITELEKQAKADLRLAAAAMEKNPAEAERLVDEHNKKMRKAAVLAARQDTETREAEKRQGQPAPLPPQIQSDIHRVFSEHPWLMSDSHARQATDALVDRMVANGSPNGYATFKAAATQ